MKNDVTMKDVLISEALGMDSGQLTGPFWVSEPHEVDDERLSHYNPMTVELWNTTMPQAAERIADGKPQRFMVAWPELHTQFEVVIVPCNNKWDEMRMTGTTSEHALVAIDRHGAYAMRVPGLQVPSYLMEKLNLGLPEAYGMHFFLVELSTELERIQNERSSKQ